MDYFPNEMWQQDTFHSYLAARSKAAAAVLERRRAAASSALFLGPFPRYRGFREPGRTVRRRGRSSWSYRVAASAISSHPRATSFPAPATSLPAPPRTAPATSLPAPPRTAPAISFPGSFPGPPPLLPTPSGTDPTVSSLAPDPSASASPGTASACVGPDSSPLIKPQYSPHLEPLEPLFRLSTFEAADLFKIDLENLASCADLMPPPRIKPPYNVDEERLSGEQSEK